MSTRTMRARALPLRSDAGRRIRRLSQRLFCRTNGCATYLEVDRQRGVATCPVCGDVRALA